MSKSYSIAETRQNLSALIHDAERGATVAVTRRGRPVAVLVSAARWNKLAGARRSFWDALQEFRQNVDLAPLGSADWADNLRDHSQGRDVDL